jgi:rubrerythrin
MIDKELIEIIQLCLALDKQAEDIYLILYDIAQDDPLKKFWKDLSEDEKKHIAYWEKLLDTALKGEIPQYF